MPTKSNNSASKKNEAVDYKAYLPEKPEINDQGEIVVDAGNEAAKIAKNMRSKLATNPDFKPKVSVSSSGNNLIIKVIQGVRKEDKLAFYQKLFFSILLNDGRLSKKQKVLESHAEPIEMTVPVGEDATDHVLDPIVLDLNDQSLSPTSVQRKSKQDAIQSTIMSSPTENQFHNAPTFTLLSYLTTKKTGEMAPWEKEKNKNDELIKNPRKGHNW